MGDGMIRADTIEALRGISVATLTASLLGRGLRNQYLHGVQPLVATETNMVGLAFTLRFVPAREDIDDVASLVRTGNVHRRAIEECPSGAVLIIDSHLQGRFASAGDLMVRRLRARGCAGIVTDGGFRDTDAIASVRLPAYQRQTAACAAPAGLHAADLEVPIGCAGVVVYPGDVVVGDAEGVVVLPAHLAAELAAEGREATDYQVFAEFRITQGASIYDVFPPSERTLDDYHRWARSRTVARAEIQTRGR